MSRLICPRGAPRIVRPWCDYRVAYFKGKIPSARKERRGKSRTGSMPVVLRKILCHQAPQENLELIPASKKNEFWIANFMPAPAWQEVRIIPDLRRL